MTIHSRSCQHHKKNRFISSLPCMCDRRGLCGREKITHLSQLWGILLIHGGFFYRHQVKSDHQGLCWLFYVFTWTEINNSHNIVGWLWTSWLTSMFSSFSLTQFYIYICIYLYCLLPDLILKAVKTSLPLSWLGWTFWRSVCQNISCPTFWNKKKTTDCIHLHFTIVTLFRIQGQKKKCE